MNRNVLLLMAAGILFLCVRVDARPLFVIYYVAANGNDAWSGKMDAPNGRRTDGPFATLDRAREAARLVYSRPPMMNFAGVRIFLRGGDYSLSKGFVLTKEDSGSAFAPILYSSYPKETARILGGREVSGWKPVTDESTLKRMDAACRGKVMQADLKAQGITDFGMIHPYQWGGGQEPAPLELFFQDRPMTIARWPNKGWATIAATPKGSDGGMFTYEGDRPSRWVQAEDVWLHGYWTYDWADSYTRVGKIDTVEHAIYTTPPHGSMGYTKGKRFYALNLLEELDEPGEYYLDRKTGILYFWPPAPLGGGKTIVSLLDTPLIELRDASDITLHGQTLEATRGKGVQVTGGSHNRIAGCSVRNIGTIGISIDGGTENGAADCDVYETGQGGVGVNGGDRKTLTPGRNYAENNLIHDYSRIVRCYRPGVAISGVGNLVSHNLIYNGPHNAIQLSGNEHLIEFNEVHDVCRETGDVGAFYMGRDWTMRGNKVRYNYFHHLGGFKGEGFTDAMGVYLDDAASGTEVVGNVFYKAGRAVLVGGGRDNTVENNLFIACNPSIHVDARGIGWAKKYIAPGGEWQMIKKLEDVNYKQPPYSVQYPKLATILEDEPAMAKGNTITGNLIMHVPKAVVLELQDGLNAQTVRLDNIEVEIPPEQAESPVLLARRDRPIAADYKQFKPIPFQEIGLKKTTDRPTIPQSAGRPRP